MPMEAVADRALYWRSIAIQAFDEARLVYLGQLRSIVVARAKRSQIHERFHWPLTAIATTSRERLWTFSRKKYGLTKASRALAWAGCGRVAVNLSKQCL